MNRFWSASIWEENLLLENSKRVWFFSKVSQINMQKLWNISSSLEKLQNHFCQYAYIKNWRVLIFSFNVIHDLILTRGFNPICWILVNPKRYMKSYLKNEEILVNIRFSEWSIFSNTRQTDSLDSSTERTVRLRDINSILFALDRPKNRSYTCLNRTCV